MIIYIPTSGSHTAKRLSEALWSLSRPQQVRLAAEVTTSIFNSVTCTDGSVWLQVETEFDIPINPEAVLDGIADVLQPWIEDGILPADTNSQLEAFVISHRGKRLVVWDAFPQFFKDQSKTREELIALNLLANPVLP